MPWLWDSWQQYLDAVHPVIADSAVLFRTAERDSSFETQASLLAAVRRLTENADHLRRLGFRDNTRLPDDASILQEARFHVEEAIYAGEELLLYHKRLAKSDDAYGFFHQNDMVEHWDRYAKTKRIFREIHQLVVDIDALVRAYRESVRADARFLINDLDLPPTLKQDFYVARNLFSLGFDEVGLLIAGRGLEGVLRKIAETRHISLVVNGKPHLAEESEFRDLIEIMYQLRWKATRTRLIDKQVRHLLDFLRAIRNSGAHPNLSTARSAEGARESASLAATVANRLWSDVSKTRARLITVVVTKTW